MAIFDTGVDPGALACLLHNGDRRGCVKCLCGPAGAEGLQTTADGKPKVNTTHVAKLQGPLSCKHPKCSCLKNQNTDLEPLQILDIVDGTGSGDVDTSKTVEAEDAVIVGIHGDKMALNSAWQNPTGAALPTIAC